jgi:hypothetical protein
VEHLLKFYKKKFYNFNKNFGKLVETYDFPEMNHGWVVRGDLSNKKVVEEI